MKEIEAKCDTCIHHYLEYCLMAKKPNKLGNCKNYFKGVCKVSQKVLNQYIRELEQEVEE